jgi:hypothetical protein
VTYACCPATSLRCRKVRAFHTCSPTDKGTSEHRVEVTRSNLLQELHHRAINTDSYMASPCTRGRHAPEGSRT